MLTVLIRASLLYVLIIFALRLMGKRQLGELQPSELVITILISNIASLPIEDPSIPMTMGAIPIIVLVVFELIVSHLSLKSRSFRRFISGNPITIIEQGKVDQKALKNLRFSLDDLMDTLRSQGIFDLQDVYLAIVETNGQVSVLPKFEAQTLTPKMTGISGKDKDPPLMIVTDGQIDQESLQKYHLSKQWLQSILKKEHVQLTDVFFLCSDPDKNYTLVKKENPKPS
ncbi:MAG: DUF421 domain-containing protein [Massiliimalia sp.]